MTEVDDDSVTMSVHLPVSMLKVTRMFTPAPDGRPVIKVRGDPARC